MANGRWFELSYSTIIVMFYWSTIVNSHLCLGKSIEHCEDVIQWLADGFG